MNEVIKVTIFATTAFLSLYIFSRLLGKKQIAQLNFVDYVIGISLGSIAAEMSFDISSQPFYYYIIAMAIFFILDLVFSFFSKKGAFLKRILNGSPVVVIYEGKLDYKSLNKSGLDINDLLSMLRELSYFEIKDIHYAILEPSGKLSVMPIGTKRPTVASDLDIQTEKAHLPNYLVIDGKISFSGLTELEKDVNWLYEQLHIENKKDLKKILLASYDYTNKTVVANYK